MKLLALLRWELIGAMRGSSAFAAVTFASLFSAGLVGAGIVALSLWSPFTVSAPTFPGRADPTTTPGIVPIIGEFRGGVAFLILVAWVVLLAAAMAPALLAGIVVRDRRTGRLDLVLTDASRADVVAVAKLLAALIPLGMILLAVGPAISFAWLVGGLASADALASVAIVLVTVVVIATIGLVCAAVTSTEVAAVLTSYFFVAIFLFGPLLAGAGFALVGSAAVANTLITLDPFVALLSAQSGLADGLFHLLPSDWPLPGLTLSVGHATFHAWVANVALYAIIAFALTSLTGVILEPLHPLKTWRLRHIRLPR
jgi:hypothetical protein